MKVYMLKLTHIQSNLKLLDCIGTQSPCMIRFKLSKISYMALNQVCLIKRSTGGYDYFNRLKE